MTSELIQFAASLAAVLLLVAVVHWAGFSRTALLTGEREAREWASLVPGGFIPAKIALDRAGRGAIMADAAGALLLLRPHGAQFVAEPVAPAAVRAEGERLVIGGLTLTIGPDAARWANSA